MPVVVDRGGAVIEPALHDSRIESIHFGKSEVTLVIATSSAERVSLRFSGVRRLSSANLAEQNVVLDFWCEQGSQEVTAAIGELAPGDSNEQLAHRRALEGHIAENRLKIWRISPSYGGEFIILSSKAEFETANVASAPAD